MVNVGLLDFCEDDEANSHQEQLRISVYLAQHAEDQGCVSIWYGEHHEGSFQVSPLLMASIVLSQTSTIVAGTGGVLASYYSPLEVAYSAALLECAYPARFELGLARGHPETSKKALLLDSRVADFSAAGFAERVRTTQQLLNGQQGVAVVPAGSRPKMWLLGSGSSSARIAGENGNAYCHAAFLKGSRSAEESFQEYKAHFATHNPGGTPEYALALAVCSDQHNGEPCLNRLQGNPSFISNLQLPPAALAQELVRLSAEHSLNRVILLQAESSYLHRLATLEAIMREVEALKKPA